jgi:hypothetical protein
MGGGQIAEGSGWESGFRRKIFELRVFDRMKEEALSRRGGAGG